MEPKKHKGKIEAQLTWFLRCQTEWRWLRETAKCRNMENY